MPLYDFQCRKCNKVFDEFARVGDAGKVKHCGVKAKRLFTLSGKSRHTGDLQYNFVAEYLGDKPVQINSRTQYRRLLKKNNLVDASPKECLQVKPDKNSQKYHMRKLGEKVKETMGRDGVLKHFPGFLKSYGKVAMRNMGV